MNILDIILFLWQLPQHLLALFLLMFSKTKKEVYDFNVGTFYYQCSIIPRDSAISLGNFVLSKVKLPESLLRHECGHQIQSLYLGPLYLIIVGIPSFVRVIIFILFKKSNDWYYSGYPESWADKLGGVKNVNNNNT